MDYLTEPEWNISDTSRWRNSAIVMDSFTMTYAQLSFKYGLHISRIGQIIQKKREQCGFDKYTTKEAVGCLLFKRYEWPARPENTPAWFYNNVLVPNVLEEPE